MSMQPARDCKASLSYALSYAVRLYEYACPCIFLQALAGSCV